jgi:TonB family protein
LAAPVPNRSDQSPRPGYLWAILVSAAGHAAFFLAVLVILPLIFKGKAPPNAYTVKIVDALPAGDLGTHLPRLGSEQTREEPPSRAERHTEPEATPAPTPPPDNDKNALVLHTKHTVTPTPTPPPTPVPAVTPPSPEPTPKATPRPRKRHEPKPTPVPTLSPEPKRTERHKPKPIETPALVKTEPNPHIRQKLEKVREHLLAEHLREMKGAEKNATKTAQNGGPALASTERPGKGMGVGSGSGSGGIQQDPGFLLYYQDVQEKIKKAWSFAGSNPNLSATVTFGINPDGSLNAVQVTNSSRDPAFDDSVVRAIRRAAPFAPPPEKYRPQFSAGLEAVFKLGELTS